MLFSSPRFFAFLIVTLLLLALPMSVRRKKNVLAVLSCLFYAAWDWRYLGLLLLVSVIDYVCAARIAASEVPRVRKGWVAASVISNLAILGYFKYVNFFIGTWNGLIGSVAPIHALDVLLPAGISFYTFKSMSYTIDVYRREIEPCRSHLDYVTFITFFPELIAGPIVRASVLLPQMDRDIGPTASRLRVGSSLFILGLAKKLLIADRMARVVDPVFAAPGRFDTTTTWIAVVAYAVQIYADFSGYSDMAIGTAKMVGYDLPENFDMPYATSNLTAFWRHWHMTLSNWLRDYLYIPLGGNRRGPARTYVNLAATMLLGGLWHGASWNFVLWGALHGAGLAVHRWWSRHTRLRLPYAVAQPLTLLFVVLCWIPFRARSFADTWTIVRVLFQPHAGAHFVAFAALWCVPLVVVAHVFGVAVRRPKVADALAPLLRFFDVSRHTDPISGPAFVAGGRGAAGAFLLATALLLVFFFAEVSASPFIYFQF